MEANILNYKKSLDEHSGRGFSSFTLVMGGLLVLLAFALGYTAGLEQGQPGGFGATQDRHTAYGRFGHVNDQLSSGLKAKAN